MVNLQMVTKKQKGKHRKRKRSWHRQRSEAKKWERAVKNWGEKEDK